MASLTATCLTASAVGLGGTALVDDVATFHAASEH